MQPKNSLPWDLEKAMATFQVSADWYEEYWMKSEPNDIRRRPDGSIDFDFYRERARCERISAIKEVCGKLSAVVIRLFRLIRLTLRGVAVIYSTIRTPTTVTQNFGVTTK
jgi:hypothetical protein